MAEGSQLVSGQIEAEGNVGPETVGIPTSAGVASLKTAETLGPAFVELALTEETGRAFNLDREGSPVAV